MAPPSRGGRAVEQLCARVTQAYLKLLLQLYEVGSPHAEALDQLRRESGQRGWWADYGRTVPSWFADYVG